MHVLHSVVYVCREMPGSLERLAHTGVALDNKTAVQLHKIGNPVEDEQVVAYSHLGKRHIVADKAQVEERGVQNNVAMVGDESIAFSGVVIIQTVDGEAIGRFRNQHLQEWTHNTILEVLLRFHTYQILHKCRIIHTGHDITYGMLEARLFDKLANLLPELMVVVRSDIVEVLDW